MVVFLLGSFGLYKLHMNFAAHSMQQNESLNQVGKTAQTVDGEVQSIDLNHGILSLVDGGEKFDFDFDGATVFVEDGRAVQPSMINSGNTVTVIFIKRENRNVARNILLYSPK